MFTTKHLGVVGLRDINLTWKIASNMFAERYQHNLFKNNTYSTIYRCPYNHASRFTKFNNFLYK